MWGYVNIRQIEQPRLIAYIATALFILAVIMGVLFNIVDFNSQLATIVAALLGSTIALETLFIQSKLSLRQQLNVKAIEEMTKSMNEFQSAAAILVTFSNDFVVIPQSPPAGFWCQQASDKYMKMQNHMLDIRLANTLYTAIESNEIAVIHLVQYYTFITIKIDELFEQADALLSNFLKETSDWSLTEEDYKRAVAKFSELHESWVDIASYFIDLRKLLQNELLGNIFNRKLLRRKPKSGYGTTLDQIATYEYVSQLVEEKEQKLNSSTSAPTRRS